MYGCERCERERERKLGSGDNEEKKQEKSHPPADQQSAIIDDE
jgi:hypothetical protein